ncbi:MAG TPA: GNAT family N-acetyltransferase [Methylibium sp.]|nr:GNAT family N-acetyltransferase [Methylibium sp.]
MRLADLRPGWATDFILHRFDGQVVERDDCLVVRTPSNPTYYWGNCLMLPLLPGDDELAHWLARFHEEITGPQPASRHVAIAIDAEFRGEQRPAWAAAGFALKVNHMLALGPGEQPPLPRLPRGAVTLRPLDLATEGEALAELEMTDAEGFEPVGYRAYLLRQHARYLAMQSAGLLCWFGLWCDGTLAATCGLMRDNAADGAAGRFQRVVTHAQWRRRGLATSLVHGVSRWGFERWRVRELYMGADPADVAIGIYRSVGFRDLSTGMGLQRNAPEDRDAA